MRICILFSLFNPFCAVSLMVTPVVWLTAAASASMSSTFGCGARVTTTASMTAAFTRPASSTSGEKTS
jgi:hypothetical protein